ncbi:MAG: ATP synthase subunit C [Oscillospiraceae bacterium]|jgi:V/A-type H+-transporting ATPase subunit K|nr:ATP synthase subunit C [Oscillospiraceae bacterium]
MAIYLTIPLVVLALSFIPLVRALRNSQRGIAVNRKKTVFANLGTFFTAAIVMTITLSLAVFADDPAATAPLVGGFAEGLKYLSASLSTGLATIGTGIAVGKAAAAAVGATSEDPANFSKAIIFVALGEGIAIYGLLISILILFS